MQHFLQVAAWNMPLWQEALLFGIISALSLPIGAWLGQRLSPVDDTIVAAVVAFGAGALLFAVTVELYGHALHEVAHGGIGYTEMFVTICCALLGALMYLWLNKMMEEWAEEHDDDEHDGDGEPASASSATGSNTAEQSATAQSRWAKIRNRTQEIGAEARKKRGVISAKEALALFTESSQMEKERLKNVKGRQKRALLLIAAQTSKSDKERSTTGERTPEQIADDAEEEKRIAKGMKLAQSMFLGLLVDGVPESILLGFLAAEHKLSVVLVLSLFVANFPEAFSSASLMKEANVPVFNIVGMWSALCVLTGTLAALACAGLLYFVGASSVDGEMPFHIAIIISVVEGVAGGAMIACIAAVMLPEAFGRKSHANLLMDSGFLCTAGFLTAVLIKVLGGYVDPGVVEDAHDKGHEAVNGHEASAGFFLPLGAIENWGHGHVNTTFLALHAVEHVFKAVGH